MTPRERYRADLAGGFIADPAQAAAVEHTQQLYEALLAAGPARSGWLPRWRRRRAGTPAPVPGLYLWGGVGGGKTHLLNALHASLPFEHKLRVHFHSFMQRVHAELRELGGREDPVPRAAERIAHRLRVLCVDEFNVADIADAMILGRLLAALFERGVTLVATSNLAPRDLYRDGLQRERFVPAIELIERHTRVLELASATDYRLRALERAEIYHHPLDAAAEEGLRRSFESLGPEDVREGGRLHVNGRPIATRRLADGLAWFDFDEICGGPRSAADYIEIARGFHTVLVSGIPCMSGEDDDRAARLVHLVDELYERRVNLIVSAQGPPEALYGEGRLAPRFARTRSRLVEMQSRAYLGTPHRG